MQSGRLYPSTSLILFAFLTIFCPISPPVKAQSAPANCQATPVLDSKTSLSQLSDFWFGDSSFRFAIMLASNSRAGQGGIAFINDINALPQDSKVCIPAAEEADRLRRRYDRYAGAVQAVALAEPSATTNMLDPLPRSGTYRVATWFRMGQGGRYPAKPGPYTVTSETWVTLEPHLQKFCQAYRREVSDDPAALDLRLEQRLGLPPVSSMNHFAIFEVNAAAGGSMIFRPCGTPATDTTTCPAGIPKSCDADCQAKLPFFYRQYYGAVGTARPMQYPWTSLGYTFDWAPSHVGPSSPAGYVRFGESEYVIPAGTPVTYMGAIPTAEYCKP